MKSSCFVPRLVLLTALVLGLGGCTTRDPLNPLDPDNPRTGGDPEWLTALADDQAVDLHWDVPAFTDLQEVRLVAAGADSVLWSGPAGADTLRHGPLANGELRRYRLDLLLTTGTMFSLPEVKATPGPAVAWALDSSGSLARLTPDGRAVRFRIFTPDASSIVVDPESGEVLSLNFFSGDIVLRDASGNERWRRGDFFRPTAGAFIPGGWLVTDSGRGVVARLDVNGATVAADSSFTIPVDVAPGGGEHVWVADRAGAVTRLNFGTGEKVSVAYQEPLAVAPGPDSTVWVADAGARRLVLQGTPVSVDDVFAVNLTARDDLAEVWAADRGGQRVVAFNTAGGELASLDGLRGPSSIAVSPSGDEIWVADSAAGLVRFARDGTRLAVTPGVSFPVSVAVAFSPRTP